MKSTNPPHDDNDVAMDETYDFLGESEFLPSDNDSHRDGSESLVSFGESTRDENSVLTDQDSSEDGSDFDVEEAASGHGSQASPSIPPNDTQLSDSPRELPRTTLDDAHLFNSTLTSRTMTQSQVNVATPTATNTAPLGLNSREGAHHTVRGIPNIYKKRPLRVLYHGPAMYKDVLMERLAQVIAASSTHAQSVVNDGTRFSIVPISFDDPHVTLIPSTGLELQIYEARDCCSRDVEDGQFCWDEGGLPDSWWRHDSKPDLAIYYHATMDAEGPRGPGMLSYLCSWRMSLYGVGTIDISESACTVPAAFWKSRKAPDPRSAAELELKSGEDTIGLTTFINCPITTLSDYVASLIGQNESPDACWKIRAASGYVSISALVANGYRSLKEDSRGKFDHIISTSKSAYKSFMDHSENLVAHVQGMCQLSSDTQSKVVYYKKKVMPAAKPVALALVVYLLAYQLLLPLTMSMCKVMSPAKNAVSMPPVATTSISGMTTLTPTSYSKVVDEVMNQVVATKKTSISTSLARPTSASSTMKSTRMPPAFVADKEPPHKHFQLRNISSHNGQHVWHIFPVSKSARKATDVFVVAMNSNKMLPVAPNLERVNATLWKLSLDTRGTRGPTEVLIWSGFWSGDRKDLSKSVVSRSFIVDETKSSALLANLLELLHSNFNSSSWDISGKASIMKSKFQEGSRVGSEKMRVLGNFASSSIHKITRRVQEGKIRANPVVNANKIFVSSAGHDLIRKALGFKASLKNISSSLPVPRLGTLESLHKAQTRAHHLSKKLSLASLNMTAVQEMPSQMLALVQRFKSRATWTKIATNMNDSMAKNCPKCSFSLAKAQAVESEKNVHATGRYSKVKTDGKTQHHAQKHQGRVNKVKKEEGSKGFPSRLGQWIPRW